MADEREAQTPWLWVPVWMGRDEPYMKAINLNAFSAISAEGNQTFCYWPDGGYVIVEMPFAEFVKLSGLNVVSRDGDPGPPEATV